jgi:DNA-binding CsgD family transcriptional regulator
VAVLVGRTEEQAIIADLLSATSGGVRALLLRGDSGIGKSALLQDAVVTARNLGALIFRSVGVDIESSVDYSALHQIVPPLVRAARDCPSDWARTLEQLFEPAREPAANSFRLSDAFIGILDVVAERSRVLLVIDDVQWIDDASAKFLAFATRRITNPAVSVIVALRTGFDSPLEHAGLQDLPIGPLDENDSADLLSQSVNLDVPTALQLLKESAGNPLALIELPKTLTAGQRGGDTKLTEKWTLTERLETVFAARIGELSDNARWLLLLCALDGTGQVSSVKRADEEAWWFPDLVASHEIGLISIDGDRVTFRHPLARSAVSQAATPALRMGAHARLADTLERGSEAWAWHRAASSNDADAEVADTLATLARRALSNGDSRTALRAAVRACELTPDGPARDLRAARTAFFANVSGQTDVARQIVPHRPPGYVLGPRDGLLNETDGYIAASRAFWLVAQDADIDGASALLFTALDGATNVTEPWTKELFDLLVLLCVRSVRTEHWTKLNALIAASADQIPRSVTMTRDALGDPARTAHGLAQRTAAFHQEVVDLEPWQLMWIAACAVHIDDLPTWRGEIRRVIQDEESGGSLASYLTALVLSSLDGLTSGNWVTAREQSEHGLETALRRDFSANVGDFRSVLAIISARQGKFDEAVEHVARLQEWALPLGFYQHRAWAMFAEAQIVMAQKNYDDAFSLLIGISPVGIIAPYQPVALMAFLDTVVAAWKSGRQEQAREHLAAGHEAGLGEVSPRLAFHLQVCDAIVSEGPDKTVLFEAALGLEGLSQWPFDEARVHLHYGAWLRESGDKSAARPHLQTSARIFDRLGAVPWRERAYAELEKATGGELPPLAGLYSLLTPQEAKIAVLASEGRSNKEIADALFLSPRTVASHLYKIFPKLGVASRAGLHSRLNSTGADR